MAIGNQENREKKPIGESVEGRVLEEFRLGDRRLTMKFDGGVILEVSAPGRPLELRLITSDGIYEE